MVSASGQKRTAFKLLSTAAVAALCAATVLWFGHLRLWLAVQPAGAVGRAAAAAAAASLQPGRPTLHLLEKQQEVGSLWSEAAAAPAPAPPRPIPRAVKALHEYAVPAQGSATAPASIRPSTIECQEEREIDRVCFFGDVFLWQGRVHYVSDDPNLVLPRVPLDFRVSHDYLWMDPPIVVSPQAMAGILQQAKTLVQWNRPGEDVYLWSGNLYNYGHFMGERAPSIHNTLCMYLGRCTSANASGVHVVLDKPDELQWPSYVEDAIACMSESAHFNIKAPELRDTVIVVRRLMVGVGKTCRAAGHCQVSELRPNVTRPPIYYEMYAMYRNQMGECLGFDPAAHAMLAPRLRLMVVDRHYHSGRHMLNIERVMQALRQRYSHLADIQLEYMEGTNLAQQAQLWSSASLVVQIHGASFGSWAFLPHGAAAVVFTIKHGQGGFGNVFPRMLVRDLWGVTNISAVLLNVTFNPHGRLRFRSYAPEKWSALSLPERMMLVEEGDCYQLRKKPAQHYCENWLMSGWDLEVPLNELLPGVDEAIGLLYEKQNRTLPRLPPLPAAPRPPPAAPPALPPSEPPGAPG